MTVAPRYALTISLNVLEQLGINLYSNVASVLSESVANAYDADASEIRIDWNKADGRIVISDDGMGMTEQEVNARFLKVGYNRRDKQPGLTPKGRRPMGRKGIGKLSLFSIANVVQVETVKNGEKSALLMRLEDIRQQIDRSEGYGTYNPEELPLDNIDFLHGTRIALTDLRKRNTSPTTSALRRRLARRFSVIGGSHGFRMFIDDNEVTPADRDYYDKLQYMWTYGDQSDVMARCGPETAFFDRSGIAAATGFQLTGWLGTVWEAKDLKDEEGDNLNRISISVRGKLAQEDILSDFSERGVYANYVIGDIQVDGLDIYDGEGTEKDEDAATSSRQRIVEDDERYRQLSKVIGIELKHIQNEWSKLRADAGAERAMEIPEVRSWINGLEGDTKKKARLWVGRLNRIQVDNPDERKQLIKHAVIAFEFHRVHSNLDALDKISDENLPSVMEIFQEIDGLESSLYGQIVQQRIQIIRTLQEKVDENSLEKAIQLYLFDHLWLLDPSWERVEGAQVMERRVDEMFETVAKSLTKAERAGRLDIAYRKTAGEHVIIELKRPERVVTTGELVSQVEKYHSGMKKLLEAQGKPAEPVEIVIVLGKMPRGWDSDPTKNASKAALKEYGARVVFYDQLLVDAEAAYKDYLEKRKLTDKLGVMFQAIDDYAPPEAA